MTPYTHEEKRREARTHCSGGVKIRRLGLGKTTYGWTLEASPGGIAIACRSDHALSPGALIELTRRDGTTALGRVRAVVRRAVLVHDNLRVVGAEFISFSPFPPAASGAAQAQEAECKPRLGRAGDSPLNTLRFHPIGEGAPTGVRAA